VTKTEQCPSQGGEKASLPYRRLLGYEKRILPEDSDTAVGCGPEKW